MRILSIILIGIMMGCGAPNYYADENPGQPQSELRYNGVEERWEFAHPNDVLHYNDLNTRKGDATGEWSYESPNAQPRYNPLEEKWEYSN